ncbi:MAG: Hsp20/alpha crystallin family protein [Thiohalorhabdus sp.]|uniref:Hsp20/alpha crystallin family protein n=1 Tax=Thiohalorhabdus sp. TaxID=3094134 RepID=UPI002FC3A710
MAEQEKQGQEIEPRRAGGGRSVAPFDEMERLMEDFFGRRMPSPFRWEMPQVGELAPFEGRRPRVDVEDRESDIRVRAELPGVKKDDMDLLVAEDTVTINASTREEKEEGEKEGEYYRREIAAGTFARTLALPAVVDADNAKATFQDGVLQLTLPKREQAKRRQIPVE